MRTLGAIRRYILALVIGFGGAALFFAGWHLWVDHNHLHELVQIETLRQRALAKPEAPRAPGP